MRPPGPLKCCRKNPRTRSNIERTRGSSARASKLCPPPGIVSTLNREIVKIMALPELKERLATLGFDSLATSPEEFGARIRTDAEKWGRVIREANIKAE